MSERRRPDSGFTLIEVLVALVILATVLASTMNLAGVSIRSQDAVTETTLLHWAAKNRLVEVALAEDPESRHESVVTETLGGREFDVTTELVEAEDGTLALTVSAVPVDDESYTPYVLEVTLP